MEQAIRASLIGAAFGVAEQGASDVVTTAVTGETHVSSLGEYAESAGIGFLTGAAGAARGAKAAVGTFATLSLIGNTAGQSENPVAETAIDTAFMVTGLKYADGLTKVPGRDVSTFRDRFYTGAHTRELIRNTSIETGVSTGGRAVTAGAGVYIDSSGAVQYTSDGFGTSQSTPQRVEDRDRD